MTWPREQILGVPVDMAAFGEAVDVAERWIREGGGRYVCHLDAHAVLAARDDAAVRAAIAGADLAAPDGMPLVWIGRLRGHRVERVYGPDFMLALLARTAGWTARPCRHLLFGSSDPVLDRLVARFGGRVAALPAPPRWPWSAEEDAGHRAAINAAAADVVWVGLGAPRQELWIARNRPLLAAPLVVGVGAAFDFLAGTKPQAPRGLRAAGLEWAFRLATEPRRLAPRYLRTIPRFAVLAVADEWRRRRAMR
jgi:N-acetylglucosaminyldiphosphoundecaprenol N-acetyl-beta-D-mannosaminyltransferase